MAIAHIVLFGWKEEATPEQIEMACSEMLGLGQNCLHPQTQKPYIKSAIGGKNNSPEGHSGDSTHGFIMMFESKEDRDYYINEDPVHKAFVQSAGPIIASVRVVDFADGVF